MKHSLTRKQKIIRARGEERPMSMISQILAGGLGAIFLLSGLYILMTFTLLPMMKNITSSNWKQVEGQTLMAKMSGGYPEVKYSYKHLSLGEPQIGRRYSFFYDPDEQGTTNVGVNSTKQRLESLMRSADSKALVVFVNPDDYSEAVIDRSVPILAWVSLFFSIPFCVIGWTFLSRVFLSEHGYKKLVKYRAISASKAEQLGASRVAQFLRKPDLWRSMRSQLEHSKSDRVEYCYFLDGEEDRKNLWRLEIAICSACAVMIVALLFSDYLLVGFSPIWSWLLIGFGGVIAVAFCFDGFRRKKQSLPDYAVWFGLNESGDEGVVEMEWAYLGENAKQRFFALSFQLESSFVGPDEDILERPSKSSQKVNAAELETGFKQWTFRIKQSADFSKRVFYRKSQFKLLWDVVSMTLLIKWNRKSKDLNTNQSEESYELKVLEDWRDNL